MKGLVLEGGAMRGMFTAGVIDVMMQAGIRYDGAIGVSAGAALVIRPREGLAVGSMERDPDKLRAVYEAGRAMGKERLADVKQFLEGIG